MLLLLPKLCVLKSNLLGYFATFLTMRFMMRIRVVLTFLILAVDIGFCQSPATPAEPEASTVEPGM